jgi:hypothetical protein
MRIVTLISLGLVAAALTAGAASTAGTANGFFKTQNGRIYCAWAYGNGPLGPNSVVCGIKNGKLNPKPKNNCKKFGVDYVGNRISMTSQGRAHVQACAGDAGPFANGKATKVLKPGKTWGSGMEMSCTVTKSSATCKNKLKHGFTLNTSGTYKRF